MTAARQRRLAAVWFADIVGYTALASQNEDAALRTVDAFQRVAREVVEADRGQLVKFLGDGALAAFETAGAAVRAAARLREAYASAAREAALPEELRIGVHLGEIVTAEDGDVYGDGVNVASRLQAVAEPGEILASEDVWRQLRRREGFALEPAGEQVLKGIADPVATYRVTEVAGLETPSADEAPAETVVPPARSRRRKTLSLLGIGAVAALVAVGASSWFLGRGGGGAGVADASVAVLPFKDMSASGDQEYFADGMTEEILNALAQVPDLRVAARTSSFSYKGKDADVREVARDLGVATVLEGSIRKDGDQLRITAQLVKASDGFHLWSETYDRRLEGVFAIQEEIAEAIAKELKGSLGLESAESLIRNRTQDMGAYELYLEARGEVRRRGPGLPRAIDLFEQALARDSTFAPAWAGLAEAFSISPYYTGQGTDYWKEAFARAESAAERALELDPTLVSAHVALGNVHRDRWEWAEAERSFLRALELAPDDPEANQQYAEMLAGMGRPGEGAPFARRSVELDPLAAIRHNVLGYILWDDHQYEEGMASIRRALEIDSTLSFSRNSLVEQLLARGRYAEAEAALDEMGIPYEEGRRKLARALAAGDRAAATRALHSDSLLQSLYWAQALVGDRDGVIDALTGALAGGFFGGPFGTPDFLWDPVLDPYRDDPRFQALIRSRNLEPR